MPCRSRFQVVLPALRGKVFAKTFSRIHFMTQELPPHPGADFDASDGDPGGPAMRRIPRAQLTSLWLSEVPKVVQRHEAERLQLRRDLGLIS
jgi:hypothetical protein